MTEYPFPAGTTVKITSGAYKGRYGVIDGLCTNNVSVRTKDESIWVLWEDLKKVKNVPEEHLVGNVNKRDPLEGFLEHILGLTEEQPKQEKEDEDDGYNVGVKVSLKKDPTMTGVIESRGDDWWLAAKGLVRVDWDNGKKQDVQYKESLVII